MLMAAQLHLPGTKTQSSYQLMKSTSMGKLATANLYCILKRFFLGRFVLFLYLLHRELGVAHQDVYACKYSNLWIMFYFST